ncbi:hypothetical protein [Nocardioides aquaticus]|nr:hypothetical protein [Nocardioides aquaticus]
MAIEIMDQLHKLEGYVPTMRRGTRLVLRNKGGGISMAYTSFKLTHPTETDLELWTDIEFVAMSHTQLGYNYPPAPAFYHELDLVIVEAGTTGRPRHDEIVLAVECKNTSTFEKRMAREALGLRRELSLLVAASTRFQQWPYHDVHAEPASALLVYADDPAVTNFNGPGLLYGIHFAHLAAP